MSQMSRTTISLLHEHVVKPSFHVGIIIFYGLFFKRKIWPHVTRVKSVYWLLFLVCAIDLAFLLVSVFRTTIYDYATIVITETHDLKSSQGIQDFQNDVAAIKSNITPIWTIVTDVIILALDWSYVALVAAQILRAMVVTASKTQRISCCAALIFCGMTVLTFGIFAILRPAEIIPPLAAEIGEFAIKLILLSMSFAADYRFLRNTLTTRRYQADFLIWARSLHASLEEQKSPVASSTDKNADLAVHSASSSLSRSLQASSLAPKKTDLRTAISLIYPKGHSRIKALCNTARAQWKAFTQKFGGINRPLAWVACLFVTDVGVLLSLLADFFCFTSLKGSDESQPCPIVMNHVVFYSYIFYPAQVYLFVNISMIIGKWAKSQHDLPECNVVGQPHS